MQERKGTPEEMRPLKYDYWVPVMPEDAAKGTSCIATSYFFMNQPTRMSECCFVDKCIDYNGHKVWDRVNERAARPLNQLYAASYLAHGTPSDQSGFTFADCLSCVGLGLFSIPYKMVTVPVSNCLGFVSGLLSGCMGESSEDILDGEASEHLHFERLDQFLKIFFEGSASLRDRIIERNSRSMLTTFSSSELKISERDRQQVLAYLNERGYSIICSPDFKGYPKQLPHLLEKALSGSTASMLDFMLKESHARQVLKNPKEISEAFETYLDESFVLRQEDIDKAKVLDAHGFANNYALTIFGYQSGFPVEGSKNANVYHQSP